MATEKRKAPGLSSAGHERATAREARLAEALRENLRRRKAQHRARVEAPSADRPDAPSSAAPATGRKE